MGALRQAFALSERRPAAASLARAGALRQVTKPRYLERSRPAPLVLAALVCRCACAIAATAPTNSLALEVTPPPGLGLSFLRLLGALALVLALFFAALWAMRRWRGFPMAGRDAALRIVETRSIGPRNSLLVVGYHRQRFLLGVSPAGIHLVSALPEADAAEAAPPPPSFGEALRQVLTQKV
jgi:flagellar biosynthetic protein FliO